jgi:hypothetical protein
MAIGVNAPTYPAQPDPPLPLLVDDCYYLVRLHEAQAYFEAGPFTSAANLLCSSSVKSSFLEASEATQSLHQVAAFAKNTPCYLGLGINLTDWLPARAIDSLRVTLRFSALKDVPLKNFLDRLDKSDLVSKVSLLKPDWAVALKVSALAGKFLGTLIGPGGQSDFFSMDADLNVGTLKGGFWAVLGPTAPQIFPAALKMADGRLRTADGKKLLAFSYAVLEVVVLKRRGPEVAREAPWWQLLDTARQEIVDAAPLEDAERAKYRQDWKETLRRVRELAKKDRSFLLNEIKEIIQSAQLEVAPHLKPSTAAQAVGAGGFPPDWRELLGVASEAELHRSVATYRAAVGESDRVRRQYGA